MNVVDVPRKVIFGICLATIFSANPTVAFISESSAKRISTKTTTTTPKTPTTLKNSEWSDWSSRAGDSALRQVQMLASKVAESTAASEEKSGIPRSSRRKRRSKSSATTSSKMVGGIGGVVFNNPEYNRNMDENTAGGAIYKRMQTDNESILNPDLEVLAGGKREDQVWVALANLELDSKFPPRNRPTRGEDPHTCESHVRYSSDLI